LSGLVPPAIRVGLIVDNSDSADWDVSNVRVEGPGGVSSDQDVTIDGGSDLVQFDIAGALDGEVYTIYGTSAASGALIGGVTFDSIPEPGSLSLLAAGGLLFLRRRRRAAT
jgi:hypothetical protein